jgi:choice-of-anchor A domain-containing protein
MLFSREAIGLAGVLICALVGATTAQADTAKDYNLFVFDDYTASGTDTEGRVAVGGNATISNYAVGAQLDNGFNGMQNLVVGGDLSYNSGQVFHGSVVASSISLFANVGVPNGSVATGAGPVDFAAEEKRLVALSASLGSETATGTTTNYFGGLYFTGSNPGLNIFNISGAELGAATGFNIAIPTGAFALFNISGYGSGNSYNQMQNFGFGTQADPTQSPPAFTIGGLDATHYLYNFKDATNLTMGGIGVIGSILAPDAATLTGSMQINGTLIVKALSGMAQINYHPYGGTLLDGNPTSVPEPASWTMLITGFGLTGTALRRRAMRTA